MALFLPGFPRYNRNALACRSHPGFPLLLPLAAFGFWAASCVAPLGPGYTIEKQEIRVKFTPAPEPLVRVEGDYQLANTGTRSLSTLELRLPGRRRFHYAQPTLSWDGTGIAFSAAPENRRDAALSLPAPWAVSARHTLHLSVEYRPAAPRESTPSFTSASFFLPAEGWLPELLPARGLFATGGVPPKKWNLTVRVPQGFLVHSSGGELKSSRGNGELILRAVQHPEDRYPFVIAGHFSESQIGGGQKVFLCTHAAQQPAGLRQASDALSHTMEEYDSVFGSRSKAARPVWIVECPVAAACFSNLNPATAQFLGESDEPASAEMVSLDTMVVDLSAGAPHLAALTAPSLASSWLGYGQNPGFYEQEKPLSLLPAFAASIGRDAEGGPAARAQTIRRVLRVIPRNVEPRKKEDEPVLRAKSFLLFYALQDRYGREVFRNAMRHMLDARRGRDFNLSDLIAAFDQESHRNAAEFVRHWMKRPGVPDEFRALYENAAMEAANFPKETTP